MPRNRLDELQAASKHAPITEEEEMMPLTKPKNKDKKEAMQQNGQTNDDFQSFLDAMEEVVVKVDQAEKNTLELRALQRKILIATHKDEASERRMQDLMEDNKKLAMFIRRVIQREQDWVDKRAKDKMDKQAAMEWRMRKTQVASQSRRFFDIWTSYNTNQVDFRDKSKNLLVKRCKITNSDFTDEQIETMLDEGNTAVFASSILDQERVARQQLTELQDRHDEFMKLEKSIREVHEMFMEVAALVQEQGEMVDNIAANIMAAQADVESGRKQLDQAERSAISARKKKICLVSTLVIVLLIVVLIILNEFGAFSGGSSPQKEYVYVSGPTEKPTTLTTTTPHSTTATAPP